MSSKRRAAERRQGKPQVTTLHKLKENRVLVRFFRQTHPWALGLNVDPTIISSSNKRRCHFKAKVIQGMIKQSKFSQKLKDTSGCQTTP